VSRSRVIRAAKDTGVDGLGGYILTLALNLSILLPLAGNALVNQYTLLLTNFYWIVCGLPWFFMQKKRPGPPIPKGEHWLTVSRFSRLAIFRHSLSPARMETDLQGSKADQATPVSNRRLVYV
jgi:hypothetical protein